MCCTVGVPHQFFHQSVDPERTLADAIREGSHLESALDRVVPPYDCIVGAPAAVPPLSCRALPGLALSGLALPGLAAAGRGDGVKVCSFCRRLWRLPRMSTMRRPSLATIVGKASF